jgi:Domain of unknown function (DUF4872)
MRPMYARFLDEARDVLDEAALADVAKQFRAAGKLWTKLASEMLPDDVPLLAKTKQRLLDFDRVYRTQPPGAVDEQRKVVKDIVEIKNKVAKAFPIAPAGVQELLQRASDRLLEIHRTERAAIDALREVVS